MTSKRPPAKGEQARHRILDAALRLFAAQGFEKTTMRQIAGEANSSLGLTYRYFKNKEDLVIALYALLAADYARLAQGIPPAPMAQRFSIAMGLKLKLLEPHRDVLSSVFMSALQPRSGVFVFGEPSGDVRDVVLGTWRLLVATATDAPDAALQDDVVMGLFMVQLAIIFYWLHDPSPDHSLTTQLTALAAGALEMALSLGTMPQFQQQVHTLAALMRPVFAPKK